jgi:hypothetical protein
LKLPYTLEHTHRNVVTVRFDVVGGFEWSCLLRSDAHHDNPHCDQKLEREHLQQAKDRNAGIIDAGDLCCVMQGKWDKRADKTALRPEHQTANYFDSIVNTAADFYEPFAKNFIVMGEGNHESAVRKRHETDLVTRIVERLNTRTGSNIQRGGYSFWVRFMFTISKTHRTSRLLHGFHGTGGGGPVTRGVIQTNRMAVFHPDPDVILTGHTHDQWIVPIARQRISDSGVPFHDEQVHVRTPGYKDGWGDGYGGWETEKMLGPKPKGAAWLTFKCGRRPNAVEMEVTRAQ